MSTTIDTARLTCPACGAESAQRMPTDACIYFLPCPVCEELIEPKPGDCCVFCSHADLPCPPVQAGNGCCDGVDSTMAATTR